MERPFDATDFPVRFGRRLRLVRNDRRMSQLALAARVGLVQGTICNIERGYTVPSIFTVFVLAQALEVHPKTLLFDEEE